MHRALVISLWAILTLAALVVIFGFFATRGTVDRRDLPRVQVDAATRQSATDKLEAFYVVSDVARAGGREEPVQLNFTHDELTSLVADWGRMDHWFGSIESMQLALQPSELVLSGVIQTLGLEFPFRLDVHASIENNQRTVELTRLQIGELFAPGFVRNIALELALRTVDAGLPRIPIETESLVLADGELIVSGIAVP
jgi:hypothetical protein